MTTRSSFGTWQAGASCGPWPATQPLPFAPPGATSFPIGELNLDDRGRPLAAPMPVILAPRFINPDPLKLADNLSLEPAVSAKLRDATDVSSRGAGHPTSAVFVSADEMPGAIRPSGIYTLANGQVTVQLGLSRDGNLLTSRIVQGPVNDIPALATKIVETILKAAKNPADL
jgi:hypothetical protein